MAEPAEMAETVGAPLRARPGRDDVRGLAVIGLPFASRDMISRAVETPIEIDWTGPRALIVRIPAADLRWEMRLARTPITWIMNLMMAAMPAALFRSNLMLWMMSAMSTALLAAGRFRLGGHVPNRQWFQAAPRRLWMIPEARAAIAGRDFGRVSPLAAQAALGELLVPQRGVLMFGDISFEAYSPERHLPAVH
jgi:hypothetical protein